MVKEFRRWGDVPTVLVAAGRFEEAARRGTVLFFHGLGASKEVNMKEYSSLAEHGFLAVGIDNAGHGERRYGDFDARFGPDAAATWRYHFVQAVRVTAFELPALVDALEAEGLLHAGRLGACGISMGACVVYAALPIERRIAAAAALASALGIGEDAIRRGVAKVENVPGRMEYIQREPFAVVVDYAHTPDALHGVYQTFKGKRMICVLGAAGGGRDKWKRPEFGRIASEFCDEIILTNEDPYDENPETILSDIEKGATKSVIKILDRADAIRHAIRDAQAGDAVIITGKGCEPWLMGPHGTKTPWDDRKTARDALAERNK